MRDEIYHDICFGLCTRFFGGVSFSPVWSSHGDVRACNAPISGVAVLDWVWLAAWDAIADGLMNASQESFDTQAARRTQYQMD